MWQLAQAKNKLSEVFTRAMSEGPQTITRRDEEALLISRADYDKLAAGQPKRMSLGEFLLRGPSLEGLDLERQKSPMRPVDLE